MTGVCQGASDSTHIVKVESTGLADELDIECRWRERPTCLGPVQLRESRWSRWEEA